MGHNTTTIALHLALVCAEFDADKVTSHFQGYKKSGFFPFICRNLSQSFYRMLKKEKY